MGKKKNRLSERAMLIHLRTSSWLGRTKDKKVTSEVCSAKNAGADAGSWWTYLVPKHAIRNVEAARMRCRNTHFKYTLPWLDGSIRILPSAMYMTYTTEMRKVIAEHEEAVRVFLKDYPGIVSRAEKRLGKLKEGRRFPTVEEIKRKFQVFTDVMPVPEVSDFRCKLGNDELDDIRNNFETSYHDKLNDAMASVWNKLAEMIEKIEKKMKEPKGIFRNSLISNLKDFCELIPKMNLTNDNNLEQMRKEVIKKLANLNAPDLRVSKKERRKAHKTAKEIMNKLKDYTN